jgi:hypothetical protein
MPDNPDLLTRHEAAALLGLSVVRVKQLRSEGQTLDGVHYRLPSVRNVLTNRVGIPRQAVMDLKAARDRAAKKWQPVSKVG